MSLGTFRHPVALIIAASVAVFASSEFSVGREPASGGAVAPAAGAAQTFDVALKADVPAGYRDRVGRWVTPLRQDIATLKLTRRADGLYDVEFPASANVPAVKGVDFRPFMPRVPKLARGNAELTRIALIQRELNRNQTRFDLPGFGSAWIANNCLKRGLWEVGLDQKDDQGWITTYHAWFDFPREEYERLFAEVNQPANDPEVKLHPEYPELNQISVPMDELRFVTDEIELPAVDTNAAEPIAALPEQARKIKLVIAPDVKTYGDWTVAEKQPVTTGRFSEPGFYNNSDPVKFDLTWLAKPAAAQWRTAKNPKAGGEMAEIEIRFENGHRLIVGADQLGKLPARAEKPKTEKDVLQLTFGISTPQIYADAPERDKEFAAEPQNYLLLLDGEDKHIDNHKAGLDRVYAWRDASNKLHLYLVGYERIALVGHLSVDVPHAPAQGG